MTTFLGLLLFLVLIAWVLGLVKPSIVKLDSRKKVSLYSGLAIVAISLLIGFISPTPKTEDLNTQPTNTEVAGKKQETPPVPVEVKKEWKSVIKVNASSNKQTEGFNFIGGQQKIVYKNTGAMCLIYVMKENYSLDKDGGFPEVTISDKKSDETMMRKDAGNYYLDIKTVNGNCDVEILELR